MELETVAQARLVAGPSDAYLRRLAEQLGVSVVARGRKIVLEGESGAAEAAAEAVAEMASMADAEGELASERVLEILSLVAKEEAGAKGEIDRRGFEVGSHKFVRPRTEGQWEYARALTTHDIVFATGPAGTGKTYLAVAAALAALKKGSVNRIVLARPAVEAGEKLGFLPGDLLEKVNPYLRPLYDGLQDMMSFAQVEKYIAKGIIEVVPLAFMRGRTLNRAAVILDEAQNTSGLQMKMFLTRLGLESKAAITGDTTQIDLESPEGSGLIEAAEILAGIDGIAICRLTERDIVRHALVRSIVSAYEEMERAKKAEDGRSPAGKG